MLQIAMQELLKAIASHLEFFGYTSTLEGDILKVSHPQGTYFWVFPLNQGVLFRSLFKGGPAALEEPAELNAFLNRANSYCVVSRFVFKDEWLSVQAWFPNSYEKNAFAAFFTRYILDIAACSNNEPDTVAKFFPPPSPAVGK